MFAERRSVVDILLSWSKNKSRGAYDLRNARIAEKFDSQLD